MFERRMNREKALLTAGHAYANPNRRRAEIERKSYTNA